LAAAVEKIGERRNDMRTNLTLRRRFPPAILLALSLVGLMVLAAACGGEEKTSAPTPGTAEGGPALAAHKPGETHAFLPKRLEAAAEIDMGEFYFGNPQGEKNPVYRLPAGKTVGIHIHNEGAIVHEVMIGRTAKAANGGHGYQELLTELVPSDLFFYYGKVKAEVEDSLFGELEVEPGVRDIWLRMATPAELKGEWELGCFVEGHYEQGMKAKLIIE
jgi:uncharacterized cupredoxin-like copper-binding protein